MSLKVFISPKPDDQPAANGIGRVLHAQYQLLPRFDIELVDDERRADVIGRHTNDAGGKRTEIIFTHGLYWTGDPDSGSYNNWHHTVNRRIVDSTRRALAITVPSNWVAEPFRRDMRIEPYIIPHGIDTNLWTPAQQTGGYILWNKNRGGDVCDPLPAWELARRGFQVMTTFLPPNKPLLDNMSVTGAMPEGEMFGIVRDAWLYLATTKETFGIGTLEAMSCGVPVVGFDWGGTHDLIQTDVNGVLVPPYDYDALERAVEHAHHNRVRLSEAARETAKRYTWPNAVKLYADLFRQVAVMRQLEAQETGVAVVVTSYNYGHWLGEALHSLINQTVKPAEITVVDDCSADDTSEVANGFRQRIELEGIRFQVIRHEANLGVAASRNHGVESTHSSFVVCLDADDRLGTLYVGACRNALLRDRSAGIAYTGLGLIQPDGKVHGNAWPGPFDWEKHARVTNPPTTTIPTAAMFRRSMWERCGGYRQRYAPGEDTEFYTRGLSLGFTALKVTEDPFIEYRNHGRGAHQTRQYITLDDDKPWMRDKQYPIGAPSKKPPLVRSYSDPLVAVFIEGTVDIQHTIESIVGQDWREWEIITDYRHPRFPFLHRARTAPLCIRVKTGAILEHNFLTNELDRFVRDGGEWDGGETMGSCCGGKLDAQQLARLQSLKQLNMQPPQGDTPYERSDGVPIVQGDFVRMEFIGEQVGAVTFFGNNNRKYRGGNNAAEKFAMIHKDDVELLASRGTWRVVLRTAEPTKDKDEASHEPEPVSPSLSERDLARDFAAPDTGRVAMPQPISQPPTPVQEPVPPSQVEHPQEVVLDRFKPVAIPENITQDFDSVPEEVVNEEIKKVQKVRGRVEDVGPIQVEYEPKQKPRGRPRKAQNELSDDDPLLRR